MNVACTARHHNTYSAAHNHGCICPQARIIHARRSSEYKQNYRAGVRRRVPATGTIRRFQALQVLGYSTVELKAMLGRSTVNRRNLLPRDKNGTGMIQPETARVWAELYEKLCMTPATGPRANHIRAMARNKGWAGPLEWDDIDNPDEVPYWDTDEGRLERKRMKQATAQARYDRKRRGPFRQEEREAA